MKLISVVIPNYDCEEYLDKCIESVVNQTYQNLEIIICDNGSTDSSVAIIKEWAKKDDRIKALINKQNQGLINCYNRMFFEATGDYIMIQDADDWCDVTRAEKQAAIMEKYDVGLCVTNAAYYEHLLPARFPEFGASGMIDIKSEEVWAPATIMFKRSILKEIPGFNAYFDRLTSYDRYFIMEILDKFKGYYLDEHLYYVLARPNSDHRSVDLSEKRALLKIIAQDTYDLLKQQRMETGTDWIKENNMKAINEYEEEALANKNYIANKLRTLACIQIDHRNFYAAKELLSAAIKKAPLFMDNYKSLAYYYRAKSNKKKENKNSLAQQ